MRAPAIRRPEELLTFTTPATAPATATARRKGTAIRAWVVIPESGGSKLEELGKHIIMRRTGLPARDLRILDPALSYPSSILGRERAIVVNLEHVRAVITAAEVLIPKSRQPDLEAFIVDIESRISAPQQVLIHFSPSTIRFLHFLKFLKKSIFFSKFRNASHKSLFIRISHF